MTPFHTVEGTKKLLLESMLDNYGGFLQGDAEWRFRGEDEEDIAKAIINTIPPQILTEFREYCSNKWNMEDFEDEEGVTGRQRYADSDYY